MDRSMSNRDSLIMFGLLVAGTFVLLLSDLLNSNLVDFFFRRKSSFVGGNVFVSAAVVSIDCTSHRFLKQHIKATASILKQQPVKQLLKQKQKQQKHQFSASAVAWKDLFEAWKDIL